MNQNVVWTASAPSNIALIKYMGKTDHDKNMPSNVSFSYTTEHLRTYVEMELHDGSDSWQPLTRNGLMPIELSQKGQERYLDHLTFLKKTFSFSGNFKVKSANNFPAACGIASSASSFAALTLCAAKAIKELRNGDLDDSLTTLCQLSRQGSGSSCRSFFPGWVKWEKDDVSELQLPYTNLYRQVFIAAAEEKEVATSLAHKRVPSSYFLKDALTVPKHATLVSVQLCKIHSGARPMKFLGRNFGTCIVFLKPANPPLDT